MNCFRILSYFILLSFLHFLLSCNDKKENRNDSSTQTKNNNTTLNTISAEPPEIKDPYWQNKENIGVKREETKQQLIRKSNTLLVFHAEDTMEVSKTYLATLALAKNADKEALIIKVLEASDATNSNVLIDTTIRLGKRMRAKLLDLSPKNDKSFAIEKISPDEQNLTATKEAYWQWNIEPLKEGNHELKLSVQVILGDGDEVGLPARDIPVTIFAKQVSFISKLGGFFSKYWQWIITGILIPLFIGFYTAWLKQKPVKNKNQT